MTNQEKILNIVENNGGFITSKEIVKNNINKVFLSRLVKNGNLKRISTGYYGLPNYIQDDFYRIQSKSKKAIYSLTTALYFHDLSDRTPLVLDITVPYDYNGSLRNDKNVVLNFVKRELLDLGVIEITSPFGMKIKVYDIERTICDIIKNRKKVDAEILSKALKEYSYSKNKNLNKLMKYAKAMNVEKKVREYMEVLLS